MINYNDYISGGYLITKIADLPPYSDSNLLPAKVLTVSNCITDLIPNAWAFDWSDYTFTERLEEAERFSITSDVMNKVIKSVSSKFKRKQVGWPGVFYTLEEARNFVNRFLRSNPEPLIINISLYHSFVQTFLEEQIEEKGKSGIYDALCKSSPPSEIGEFVGFEVLGYDYSSFHSWLCHNLEKEVKENFGITANDKGLFKNLEDVTRVATYYSLDETGTEPVQWLPWLLLQYSR